MQTGAGPMVNRAGARGDTQARLYSTDGKVLEFFAHEGPVLAAACHSDGKRTIRAGADKSARVWTPAIVWEGQHTGAASQVVFSPKADRIISGGADKLV